MPTELTSFVGRRDESATIKRRLGTARLLTLTGPGGVGKTRLALRTARDLVPHYPDGVWWVPLASLQDPLQVTQAVVTALGLQDRSVVWSLSMLEEHLAGTRMLLVIDNCEHVLEAVAGLAGTLLRACPEVTILATSRQTLGIAGEVVEQVPPMSMPEPDISSSTEAWRSDAVTLFVERAAARGGGFTLDANSAPAVLEICRGLDGLPLALELAAVRLNGLGIGALSAGLRERMSLLGTGDRSDLPRQRTMEGAIDWSYQLLARDERLLWARLSVFAGGFEIDAAQEVCGDAALDPESIPALLAELVEKSVLKRAQGGSRDRFRMLEILRQFGAERLRDAGAERELRVRHAEWIGRFASDVAVHRDRLVELFARARAEQTNIWTALDFCLGDAGEVERGIAICRDLYTYWLTEGRFAQVRGILMALLERVPTAERPRADGLWVSAFLSTSMGDHESGRRLAEEALSIGRSIGAADIVASALIARASASWFQGHPDEAIADVTEALGLARPMGFGTQELTALNVLALGQRLQGDTAAAVETGHEALRVSDRLGETWLRAYALHFLAVSTLREGRPDEAQRLAREGLEIRRDLGHVSGIASLAEVLAYVDVANDQRERAATLFGGADAIWASISWVHTESMLHEHDRVRAETRARLGAARYQSAYDTGSALTLSEVIAVAGGAPVPERRVRAKEAPQPSAMLSPREMEVARLVADGATNAQAAAQLFISERTVESHVTNIFNKLGVDSRVQVARWVATMSEA
ncbi:MAG TPA: LuxR C-terminal-related transcriptional regulator [Candidatus Limnocylindria bacterium]|nr:LuxR C-terminal-related transcriptional regulator [Candidatus Limnocylindria bacterium]